MFSSLLGSGCVFMKFFAQKTFRFILFDIAKIYYRAVSFKLWFVFFYTLQKLEFYAVALLVSSILAKSGC